MGDDIKNDSTWDLPAADGKEPSLDESADNALKKVGEPMTTDIGTNFEHSKPSGLADDGNDKVENVDSGMTGLDDSENDAASDDLAFINEQIKADEASRKPAETSKAVEEPDLPLVFQAADDKKDEITFGNYSNKEITENKYDGSLLNSPSGEKKPEIMTANGSLAELAEKSSAKKAELEEMIKKSQAELEKITEIEDGIKDLQSKEADLMAKANGLL